MSRGEIEMDSQWGNLDKGNTAADPDSVPSSTIDARQRNYAVNSFAENQGRDNAEDDDSVFEDSDPMLDDSQTAKQLLIGTTYIKGPNTTCKVIALTICLAGLQFTWTVEMAYGTPYLLSLGLSKSSMSLVWIAGPLSGLLMQPIVGVLSDRCTSKFGRRRPFLLLGSAIVALGLLLIGWTREITSIFTGSQEGDTFKTVSIAIAIASIYILDFSINCVQASCRALLVDSLPPSQQEEGTAWAGRMVGIGNVAGYFMGYADLVAAFPFLGNTQLKVLCVVAAIVLLSCDVITCFCVSEKILSKEPSGKKTNWKSPFRTLSAITTSIWNLPKPIQRICNVQFFAWIGWFPFLFYSTTWVAEIYDQTALQNPPDDSSDAIGQATRAGSFAFLVYSLVSLSASFVLPLIVSPSYEQEGSPQRSTRRPMIRFRIKGRTYSFDLSRYLRISFLTLPRAWTASHIIFCLAMMSTIFVSDVTGASVVIGICGISWSLTMWAPFSLLGEYISETESKAQDSDSGFDAENRLGMHPMAMASKVSLAAGGAGLGTEGGLYHLVEQQDDSEAQEIDGQIELQRRKSSDSRRVLFALEEYKDEAAPTDRSAPATSSHDTEQGATDSRDDDLRRVSEHVEDNHMISKNANPAPSAGVLLGIHNMYVVLPQFLVTFFSSVIFHFLEKGSSTEEEASPDAIGIVLRFGAIMAGIAGYLSTRIGRSS